MLCTSVNSIDETVCAKGWSRTVRPPVSFTNRIKHIKLRQYDIPEGDIHEYELDHLIPLSIGGAPDDPANLWPQPHQGTWTADDKDALEARIHRLVCDRRVPLAEAQQAMRTDWVAAYRKYMSRRSQAWHAGRG